MSGGNDLRAILKDKLKQRNVQYGTGTLALGSVLIWLMGIQEAAYIAALFIILCAVATIRWLDDDEKLEEVKKT